MASIIKIELNLVPGAAPGGIMPRVRVSQGDAQDRILQFELYDGSEVADLTDVVSIFFGGQKPDGNGFTVLCTSQNNLVTGILTPQSTVLAGLIQCKLYLTTATGSVRSATFDMQIDPDPLNEAGTSETDITAIVAAAGNYAAAAQQSAEDAAASAETAATAGAAAGEAAAQVVVNNKLDKVGGDSAADIITFTSSDDATESGIIIPSGGEENVPALVTGATHAGLLGNLSKIALNSRKLINTVKRIWTSVANTWASGAEYKAGNVVTYINGHTYICILDHTSSSSITPLHTTYWEDKTLGDMIYSLNSNYTISTFFLDQSKYHSIGYSIPINSSYTFQNDGMYNIGLMADGGTAILYYDASRTEEIFHFILSTTQYGIYFLPFKKGQTIYTRTTGGKYAVNGYYDLH